MAAARALSPYTWTTSIGALPAGTYVVSWIMQAPIVAFEQPPARELLVTDPRGIPALSWATLLSATVLLSLMAAKAPRADA